MDPDAHLTTLLRERGYRVTPQRLAVHRLLRERDRHLTVDEIQRELAAKLPGISAPTVYATLDLLAELGLARRIDVGTGATLYDSRAEAHHHTVCRRCGKVEDLDGGHAESVMAAARRSGFDAQQIEVVVSGLCASCAAAG
jgi:Fe2+ or Zn2+ uptake regulation protein